jgi:hypothetical protein
VLVACERVQRLDLAAPQLVLSRLGRAVRRGTLVRRGLRVGLRPTERVTVRARLTTLAGRMLARRTLRPPLRGQLATLRVRGVPRRAFTARLTLVATDRAGKPSTVRRTLRVRP